MEPKLVPKSMKNRFQEALNKKDEKWSQKSHAAVCDGVQGCAGEGLGGPLKPISPEGPEGQPGALGHSPRAVRRHGGGFSNSVHPAWLAMADHCCL